MKDGMEYAEMLGAISVSSCEVSVKPAKRRRKKDLKEEVVAKINEEKQVEEIAKDYAEYEEISSDVEETYTYQDKPRKKFKIDVLYVQGIAIFALVVTILLTNIFWENSGINTLFKNAFSTQTEQVDARTYLSFSAKSPSNSLTATVDEGVMTFSGKGALYPVCDGEVSSIVEEDGKYTLTIEHSDKFKTVISGVDFVYTENGSEVFAYIPVAFIAGGDASVCMYDDGKLLTDYIVEDGAIIWES
ncbi:MAG: hypothetical protein E7360_03680 [Clostridiales bacterium]|nr:hypothetical protein [Clostridiales bacterium]